MRETQAVLAVVIITLGEGDTIWVRETVLAVVIITLGEGDTSCASSSNYNSG